VQRLLHKLYYTNLVVLEVEKTWMIMLRRFNLYGLPISFFSTPRPSNAEQSIYLPCWLLPIPQTSSLPFMPRLYAIDAAVTYKMATCSYRQWIGLTGSGAYSTVTAGWLHRVVTAPGSFMLAQSWQKKGRNLLNNHWKEDWKRENTEAVKQFWKHSQYRLRESPWWGHQGSLKMIK